ncbi:uncharacterized protein [Henckelia pumila]|uniref:uncharacterized protein isoform X2 n=1 Tax=Henckelia pumila TaxID=405737 RepID=UPI003C6DC500
MNPQSILKENESLCDKLFNLSMRKQWTEVVSIYTREAEAQKAKITKSEETALHVAISNYNPKRHGISVGSVKKMLDSISDKEAILSIQNERGNTPLYLAAKVGWVAICEYIALQHPKLIAIRNVVGQTPLYAAARHGKTEAFVCLYEIYKTHKQNEKKQRKQGNTVLNSATGGACIDFPVQSNEVPNLEEKDKDRGEEKKDQESDESLCRRKDGNTVLHSAIAGAYFAFQIIKKIPKLVNSVNVEGESPLHVLAKKPNLFKSSSHMGLYDSVIYHCIFIDELKEQTYNPGADQNESTRKNVELKYPNNYKTCVDIFQFLWNPIYKSFPDYGKQCKDTDNLDHAGSDDIESPNESKTAHGKDKGNPEKGGSNDDTKSQNRRANESKTGRTKLRSYFPENYTTDISLFKFAVTVILTVLGVGLWRIQKIQEKKKRYTHALQIMNEMIVSESRYKYDSNGQKPAEMIEHQPARTAPPPSPPPDHELVTSQQSVGNNSGTTGSSNHIQNNSEKEKVGNNTGSKDIQNNAEKERDQNKSVKKNFETPLLVAAKMGILEMVEKIYDTCPVAIQDLDPEGKNVLLLAAENKQTSVFDFLLKTKPTEDMFHHVDYEGNSILHLAAMMGKFQPWRIPGAALQMQGEINWYKYVKHSIPQNYLAHNNFKGDTPRQIFTETHKELLKEGTEWLTKTSESCSVVAALIAAVAFATSATVPGGLNDQTGRPILTDNIAFDFFSISSLVALCLSVTALVFFLAIITSRCQERDFKGNLPRKLLYGLTSLFSSIAAMLVSFCAGHTFILRTDLRFAVVPIYAFACVPVTLFAVAQLPLYFDILRATCTKAPLRSYKVFYQ